MAKATAPVKTFTVLPVAVATGTIAFLMDKLAQWIYPSRMPFVAFFVRNDLEYLPSLLALVVVGFMFRKNRKSQLIGMIAAVVSAMLLHLCAAQFVALTNWSSTLWGAVGYQTVYLFIPSFLAVVIGGYTAQRIK